MTEDLRDVLLQRFESVYSGYGATDIEIGMAIEGRMVRNKDVGKYFESLVVIWCETADDHGNHTLFFSRKMLVEVEGG